MASASLTSYQAYYRDYQLPWSVVSDEQEQKFRKILTTTLIILLVLSVIWPFLPTPQPDPTEAVEIEQRFAQLILEERELPPPPPPRVEEEEPEPEPIEEPEQVVQEAPPEPVVEPEPQPEPEVVQPDPTPAARERASVAGLLPFSDDLAALRDNSVVNQVSGSQELTGAVGAAERNERSLITSNVGAASGGINTAQLSRNTGGTGLAGRSTTQVETPVAAVGNGGAEADVQRSGSSNRGSRSREEIEMVFDRNKGAIYALYNRALRQDPTLEGKLVLRLTISPDGVVTSCEIASSDLNNPDLERKLVQRVKLFRFEAKDVEAITTTKPIDFFPA
ncbi:MAG: AgmX/PglI C-terminal domain-containing protein [Pseudomonadota bacterium]